MLTFENSKFLLYHFKDKTDSICMPITGFKHLQYMKDNLGIVQLQKNNFLYFMETICSEFICLFSRLSSSNQAKNVVPKLET